jgi:hypothetical protein
MGSARASSNLVGVDISWLCPTWDCLIFLFQFNTTKNKVSSDLVDGGEGHNRDREARFYSVIG